MKTLKDCLDSSPDDMILHNIGFMYPSEQENIAEYDQALKALRAITPKSSSEEFMQGMYLVVQEYDNPPFMVSGQNGKTKREWSKESGEDLDDRYLTDELESFGMDLSPWCEWLALPVSQESLTKYSDSQVVAHCLVEMCRSGFNEEDIQEYRKDLIHELSQPVDLSKAIPSEEVFARLKERFGFPQ